ncbi:hypothetical protein Tco_1134617, partial [Tanacetum coccineum]
TVTVETVNNEEQQLIITFDGQTFSITEASLRIHLQLEDADGISSLPNVKIFDQLTLMGSTKPRIRTRRIGISIPQSNVSSLSVVDEAIIKEMHDGLVRTTTTAFSLELEQDSGNIDKTQTKARPKRLSNLLHDLPLPGVTSLEDELTSTKAVYNKAFITLTKRVKKLEKQLKHKKRRAVINSLEDEEPILDVEDSPKQGRMIAKIDKDENINLVKSSEKEEAHASAEHML